MKIERTALSVRPFIGATFAVAIYFGLSSGLLSIGSVEESLSFYAVVAFLAGFSERWAKGVLTGLEAGAPAPHHGSGAAGGSP